jgi:hypothetical protein
MRLGNTIGERINKFDNLSVQTVETFNNLFPECPITKFDSEAEVEILSPASNNCRTLLINEIEVKHKMFSDLLYNVDKEEYNLRHDEEESLDVLGVECLE